MEKVGGGLFVYVNSPKVNSCKFLDNGYNSTDKGGAVYATPDSDDIGILIRDDYVVHPELEPATGLLDFSNNTFLGNNADYGHSVYIFGDDYAEVIMAGDILDVFSTQHESASEYWVASGYDIDYNEASGEAEAITNDVWVDPKKGIDEGNIIGDPRNPFLTINYAMSMIYPTEDNPITINLMEGTFSPSLIGESFPIIMISNVNLIGEGQEVTILDAEGSEENPRRVITIENCNNNTISDLTITGGLTGNTLGLSNSGGGIFINYSNPTLIRVNIISNEAVHGGGMYLNHSSPFLSHMKINNNITKYASLGFSGTNGGGIFFSNSNPIINHVTISDNEGYYGGGMFLRHSNPHLTHVTISKNMSHSGGGIFMMLFDNYAMMTNVTICQNTVSGSLSAAGAAIFAASEFKMVNSIIWGNIYEYGEPWDGSIIYVLDDVYDPEISFSNIQIDWSGEGNINMDPLFMDPVIGDFTLQGGSPCIDAGTADIDGDGYEDIMDYIGQAPDMGAYEFCESEIYDECGICEGVGDIYECGCFDIPEGACNCGGSVLDCAGICGGNSEEDECGICNGDGSSCEDSCEDSYTDGCDLPDLTTYITSNGSVLYNSSVNIGGFEYEFENNTIINCYGGDAEEAGLTITWNDGHLLGIFFSEGFIPSGCGTLFQLELEGDDFGMVEGGPILINDDGEIIEFNFSYFDCPAGDFNGDGLSNILDIVLLVNIILGGTEPLDAGDLNGDGILNVLDVVILVNIILEG